MWSSQIYDWITLYQEYLFSHVEQLDTLVDNSVLGDYFFSFIACFQFFKHATFVSLQNFPIPYFLAINILTLIINFAFTQSTQLSMNPPPLVLELIENKRSGQPRRVQTLHVQGMQEGALSESTWIFVWKLQQHNTQYIR